MASSSTPTVSSSRSPSPDTPDSDTLDHPPYLVDNHGWNPTKPLTQNLWDIARDASIYSPGRKVEDDIMLRLEEVLVQDAYEDTSHKSSIYDPPHQLDSNNSVDPFSIKPGMPIAPQIPADASYRRPTKPIPPPASLPRKVDPTAGPQSKVVRPSKESCYNLPIMFPSMPEGVTKSRVETQIRVTMDLVDTSSSAESSVYNRVGSWKWLKLPEGTSTKRRSRKQVKIEHAPEDTLYLSTTVTCASPPHNPVLSCSSCQIREAKRTAKKIAARVRPARSDSDSGDEAHKSQKGKASENPSSVIQLNCSEVMDFSSGTIILPLRITCYCRHHREKLGFIVHFTMMDSIGRIVGAGSTRPIMITDDHKTNTSTKQPEFPPLLQGMEFGWAQVAAVVEPIDARAPSKRKPEEKANKPRGKKPYESSKRSRGSRETSVSSFPSPVTPSTILPFASPSPPPTFSPPVDLPVPSILPQLTHDSESSTDAGFDPDIPIIESSQTPMQVISTHSHTMPFMFIEQQQSLNSISLPTIHRLIPGCGPTHGGIEVTILGANFHSNLTLSCVFGDVAATMTQRWSDNALVCVLPPRASAGVVAVWLDGFMKPEDSMNAPIFTYSDESDRALMELALQVVGLKMTGKLEDAKNVAIRIVGDVNDNPDTSGRGVNTEHLMQTSLRAATRDLGPLLLLQTRESGDFEAAIMKFLCLLDTPIDVSSSITVSEAISHQTSSGQTLLHLAAMLKLANLLRFLLDRGADMDLRDRNGFTPLHFAAFSGSRDCAQILLSAGADWEIVNSAGKTAEELGDCEVFDGLISRRHVESDSGDDSEAHWGDAEEEAEDFLPKRVPRRRRSGRFQPPSHASLPPSRPSTPPLTSVVAKAPLDVKDPSDVDEKQSVWLKELIQRTLSQFPQLTTGNGPWVTLPQLPVGLPNLPVGLPNLPVGLPHLPVGLPQLPIAAFPIVIALPGWPSFLGYNTSPEGQGDDSQGEKTNLKPTAEWKIFWEKWTSLNTRQETDLPPPVYTPRATAKSTAQADTSAETPPPETAGENNSSTASSSRSGPSRRVTYGAPPVDEQDVDAYTYQPRTEQKRNDRMLVLFWIPILFLSLLWAMYRGVVFVAQTVETAGPLKRFIQI